MEFNNSTTDKVETKELSKSQKINQKIAELKKLGKIEKDISNFKAKIAKLENDKIELEKKYNL